jgi:ABC-2 type transport system permease protein
MALSGDMAYKMNFFIKCFAVALADMVGPLLTLLIYTTTLGIPGWTMHEFLLFQGTLLIVFGLGHTFTLVLPYDVIHNIREGEFDKYLVKPVNILLYLLAESFYMEGLAEIAIGLMITVYSIVSIGIPLASINFLLYLILILAGFLIQVSMMVFISSLAFLVVRSDALMHLYFKISDFIRYPLNVYAFSIKFFLTFLFPLAISSFYPAMILLKGATPLFLVSILAPVVVFFFVSIAFWTLAMRCYTSAGG